MRSSPVEDAITLIQNKEFYSTEESDAAFEGWNMESIPIDSGPSRSVVGQLRFDALTITHNFESHQSILNWSHAPSTTTFAFYCSGRSPGAWCGQEINGDDMLVTSSDRDHFGVNNSDLHVVMVTVSHEALDSAGVRALDKSFKGSVGLNGVATLDAVGRGFRNRLFSLVEGNLTSNEDAPWVEGDVLYALDEIAGERRTRGMPEDQGKRSSNWKTVRLAVALIKADGVTATPSAVSQELGISTRKLFQAFRQEVGVSPYQISLLTRLQNARRQLLDAGSEANLVKQIAPQQGFRDPGRFAQYYTQRYGELPSETLARR